MSESVPPSDERDDTEVLAKDGHTPLEELIHDQLLGEARRDRLRIILIALGVVALLVMAAFVAQAYRAEQQARETSVDFAAEVEAAICGNPSFASLCKEAEEIIEDPENPPPPEIPEVGEPGPVGRSGPAGPAGPPGPAPTDEQVADAVRELLPELLPEATEGMPGIPGPVGPAGPAGPAGPSGPAGADGADALTLDEILRAVRVFCDANPKNCNPN